MQELLEGLKENRVGLLPILGRGYTELSSSMVVDVSILV